MASLPGLKAWAVDDRISDRAPAPCEYHSAWLDPEVMSNDQQMQPRSRCCSNQPAEIHEKEWIFFLTALRVFNFLCLPPKGFFIDKALGSVGNAVEDKLLMERLVIRDLRGLVCWDHGPEEGQGSQTRPGLGVRGDGMGATKQP